MAEIFFYVIVFYLVYRLVVDLILPVLKGSIKFHHQFEHMHDRQNQGYAGGSERANAQGSDQNASNQKKKSRVGEYIDFEEVK